MKITRATKPLTFFRLWDSAVEGGAPLQWCHATLHHWETPFAAVTTGSQHAISSFGENGVWRRGLFILVLITPHPGHCQYSFQLHQFLRGSTCAEFTFRFCYWYHYGWGGEFRWYAEIVFFLCPCSPAVHQITSMWIQISALNLNWIWLRKCLLLTQMPTPSLTHM